MLVTGLLTLQAMFVGAGPLGGTIHVPADSPTIQIAIEKAQPFDTIIVAPGTYHETINFLGKAVTVRSSGGRDITTIDATGIVGAVVACYSGEGPDTVLDGFTITGATGMFGGGMFNRQVSPTVTNCRFSGNTADFGGGMYNDSSSPTVTNCTFSGNTADKYGGGMYNRGGTPTVTNCTFSGNNAGNDGGGMDNMNSSPTVTNCTFSGNAADFGGGMYNGSSSSPTVTNCTFSGNAAHDDGGGMINLGGSLTATNCTFSGNKADYRGGGLYIGGSPTVTNCTFSGNTANEGGGMFTSYNSSALVTDCILWGDSPQEIVNTKLSTDTIRFSDVQGGLPVGAVDGGGNMDLDPMFVRPPDPGPDGTWDGVDDDYGDLRLRSGSPSINAGDPAFVAQPAETDLEGHARVLCGRVDMGAYEFGIGDYDCDQAVDLIDFANWSACATGPLESVAFHSTIGCESFDFNADSAIDLFDFAGFQVTFDSTDSNFAVFDDPGSNFLTKDVRDVDDEFVRFDTSTNSIIWAASGTAYQQGTWTVNGVFLAGGFFQVRFGTKDGQRRAYFTETGPATICQIEVSGANLLISPTNMTVPQE